MSTGAIVLMVSICGFVWGGFVLLLGRAVRRERQKNRAGGPPPRS